MLKILTLAIVVFFPLKSIAGLTAEQVLGEYWKDPLFGEAASEATISVDLLFDQVWPFKITVPSGKNIRFVFFNKSEQPHLMAFTSDISIQLADERFKKFVKDELFHSQQRVIAGRGHSHSGSSVDDAQALVKTLDQWPTIFVKPDDKKEILIRFDEPATISFVCVLDMHEEKDYRGIIEVVKKSGSGPDDSWQMPSD